MLTNLVRQYDHTPHYRLICNTNREFSYGWFVLFLRIFFFYIVPTPTVNVTAPDNQTVGQSLTLQCEVTTVKGITSRVDIVWSSNGKVLRRIDDTMATAMNNSQVYTDSYSISQLSTTDDSRVIQCEVEINTSQSVMANDNITLDVTGEYTTFLLNVFSTLFLFYTQFRCLVLLYRHLVPYKELW